VSRRGPKKEGLSPADFSARIARGEIDPLYLFLGPERLLRREAIDLLVGTVEEGFRAFNVDTLSLAELSLENALDVARQLPMMASRRLVVLTSPESIKDTAQEALEDYLKSPSDQAIVVFVADSLDLRRKSATALSKACAVVRFDELSEPEAVRWVEARVRERGSSIERTALGALVDLAGPSLARLAVEIDKLATHADGGQISLPDVKALVSRAREHQVWDLTDAIVERDRKRALRVLARQLDAGEEPLGLLSLVASTYRKMLLAKELMTRRAPAAEVAAVVKLPPWKLGDFNASVRKIPVERLTHGLTRMAEVDLAIKSSVGVPAIQLEVLVCELTA
jgi:DNA polymerase III subunit delta